MTRVSYWITGLALLSCTSACGTKTLPPAEKPALEMPQIANAVSPPPGQTQVVIDADGDDASVELVISKVQHWSGGLIETRRLCSHTPCSAALRPGSYELQIRSNDGSGRHQIVPLDVGQAPTVLRHHLFEHQPAGALHVIGTILAPLGVTGIVTGGILALVNSADGTDLGNAPETTLALSTAALALGLIALIVDRPTFTPGSTVQFDSLGTQKPADNLTGTEIQLTERRPATSGFVALTPTGFIGTF